MISNYDKMTEFRLGETSEKFRKISSPRGVKLNRTDEPLVQERRYSTSYIKQGKISERQDNPCNRIIRWGFFLTAG